MRGFAVGSRLARKVLSQQREQISFRMPIRQRQRFEIRWESRFGAWPRDLALLFSRGPELSMNAWEFQGRAKSADRKPVRGFLSSAFLHVSAFFLAAQLTFLPAQDVPRETVASDSTPIYIDMAALKILRDLPRVKPHETGGRPGTAILPARAPALGSTQVHPKYTIVLNPMKPDNNRQTIVQKSSIPDLLIPNDQKVADIILVKEPDVAKPQVDLSFHRPSAPQKADAHPAVAAPTIVSNATELPVKFVATVQQPQLPVSYINPNLSPSPRRQGSSASTASSGSANPSGNGDDDTVVISVDPALYSKLATLAQGNRYATFAISPNGGAPGSPGGISGATSGGGSGAPGTGGDRSVGVGHGTSGGGGGESRENATLSITGGSGGTGGIDSHGILRGSIRASTIFPVLSSTKLRRPPLVVSTGPMGGGGLDLYGALPCGKVYTIFLPMPGKSWVLQYCAHQATTDAEAPTQTNNNGVVRMETGLVPPNADEQFDFRRSTVAEKDADKLIVLRGLINKDGSVSDVHVFQGLQPEMDAEAVLAFSSWKFRPAIRSNVPISVDVLVGIPARVPEKSSSMTSGAVGTQN